MRVNPSGVADSFPVMPTEVDVDLFAGPGGWDEGAAAIGIQPLGIEWDDAACATRRARGHRTLQADVAALEPQEFAPVRLLIASAPCQAFSMAGLGAGRKALQAYIDAIEGLLRTGVVDRESLDEKCADPRGHLVLEPLRWAMQLRPRFVALEQVEPVLPLWEAIADALRTLGYGVWTGVLSAERYGVPQTRKRAILLAKLDGQVSEPPPTHQRYIAPRVKAKQEESLFDAPDPERIVAPEDRELLPWVSMAEALGWGGAVYTNGTHEHRAERPMSEPAPTVMFGDRLNTVQWQPDDQVGFPRRNDLDTDAEYRERDFRAASEPAFTVTEKARSAVRLRANAQSNAAERSVGGQAQWVHDRPATTVAGDPRVFPPGHKVNDDDLRAGRGGQLRGGSGRVVQHRRGGDRLEEEWSADRPSDAVTSRVDRWQVSEPDGDGAVRVSAQEAAVLQSFPPDYPWQGTRTAQYRQIGDAVPPLLAEAILGHLVGRQAPSRGSGQP